MAEPTEHLCVDGEWKLGYTCELERERLEAKRNMGTLNVNITRLRKENAEGYTQFGLERETIEAARRDGTEDRLQRPR